MKRRIPSRDWRDCIREAPIPFVYKVEPMEIPKLDVLKITIKGGVVKIGTKKIGRTNKRMNGYYHPY